MLEREEKAIRSLPIAPDNRSPIDDPAQRLQLWSNLYEDELRRVFDIRNQIAHSPQLVDQETVDEGLSFASRLLDVLVSVEAAATYPGQWVALRGSRIVDADVDLSELMARIGSAADTRVVFQEPVDG